MGWRSNPKIRDLEPYAKRHGYQMVVVFAVCGNGEQYEVNTYGRDAKLCKAAAVAGDTNSGRYGR